MSNALLEDARRDDVSTPLHFVAKEGAAQGTSPRTCCIICTPGAPGSHDRSRPSPDLPRPRGRYSTKDQDLHDRAGIRRPWPCGGLDWIGLLEASSSATAVRIPVINHLFFVTGDVQVPSPAGTWQPTPLRARMPRCSMRMSHCLRRVRVRHTLPGTGQIASRSTEHIATLTFVRHSSTVAAPHNAPLPWASPLLPCIRKVFPGEWSLR